MGVAQWRMWRSRTLGAARLANLQSVAQWRVWRSRTLGAARLANLQSVAQWRMWRSRTLGAARLANLQSVAQWRMWRSRTLGAARLANLQSVAQWRMWRSRTLGAARLANLQSVAQWRMWRSRTLGAARHENFESVTQRGDGCFQCSVEIMQRASNRDERVHPPSPSFHRRSLALSEPRGLGGPSFRVAPGARGGPSRGRYGVPRREGFVIRPFPSFFGVGLQDESRLRKGAICHSLHLSRNDLFYYFMWLIRVNGGLGSTIGAT